jgi:DNA-binding beta-propeller fold protein YncE
LTIGKDNLGVDVVDKYVYAVSYTSSTMSIVNAENPSAMFLVSSTPVCAGPRSVTVQSKYAYVTCSHSDSNTDNLWVMDISDPAAEVTPADYAGTIIPLSTTAPARYVMFSWQHPATWYTDRNVREAMSMQEVRFQGTPE